MANELSGKRVAFLVAMEGVEEVELTKPREAVEQGGAETDLVAPESGEVQAFNHLDKSSTFPVDKTLDEASAEDYDAVVLPGGVANPDELRTDERAVRREVCSINRHLRGFSSTPPRPARSRTRGVLD